MQDNEKYLTVAARVVYVLTVAWVIYVIGEIAVNHAQYRELTLNELGDFLAGVGGPIALMWLVLGYFQQSSALRLQQAELRNHVAETRRLVEEAAQQSKLKGQELEFAKNYKFEEAQPKFTMRHRSTASGQISCVIKNHGATATHVFIDCDGLVRNRFQVQVWEKDEEHIVAFSSPIQPDELIVISYSDSNDNPQKLGYSITEQLGLIPTPIA